MLTKDDRCRVSIIACKVRLNRDVSLKDMLWATELCEVSEQAQGIWDRTVL